MGDWLRELLSRRDPSGYYIIPVANREEAKRILEEHGVEYEEAGDVIYARVKSRSAAARLAQLLAKRRLLKL